MLTKNEFDNWCTRRKLSDVQKSVIDRIRTSEPSRRVGGGRKNVAGRYPSKKMGVTIQFESHRVELPKVYALENDENVLEFYDQPPPIKLDYQGKNGRHLSHYHTPDFFAIETNSAGWIECKTEKDLEKLAQKSPNRYFKDEDGNWRDRPGEQYAKQFGCYYQVFSDAQIERVSEKS